MTQGTITVRTFRYRTAYVYRDGEIIALMERSPWSGEWCYGPIVRTDRGAFVGFAPPFTPTYRKTPRAAANVVAANVK